MKLLLETGEGGSGGKPFGSALTSHRVQEFTLNLYLAIMFMRVDWQVPVSPATLGGKL